VLVNVNPDGRVVGTYTSEKSAKDTADVDESDVLSPQIRWRGNELRSHTRHGYDEADESGVPSGY